MWSARMSGPEVIAQALQSSKYNGQIGEPANTYTKVEAFFMQASASNHNGEVPIARRLAAITFVDIAVYTILMASDETRTHQRWMTILNDVILPQAAQHRGTIVKSTGDGVLVEFPSVHDAVEWARNVQRLVVPTQIQTDRYGTAPSITLRISVHFADIITTEFDVFGDGVNLAARLQEHAPAGGIVVSEAVHNLVRGSVGTARRDRRRRSRG